MDTRISRLTIALFISLAANVFAAGHFARLCADTFWSDKAQDYVLRKELSDTDRKALEAAVEANRFTMNKYRDGIFAAKEREMIATRAEPFDQKGLERALDAETTLKLKALVLMHDTRKTAMSHMSPEGRATLQKMTRLGFLSAADAAKAVQKEPVSGTGPLDAR
jgi:hypothetical protein